jgi:tetratricopeptide (TPR) repeat protein/predicted Ser/Thr protein kinase
MHRANEMPLANAATSIHDAVSEVRRRPRYVWLDFARADQSDRWRSGHAVPAEQYFAKIPELLANREEALILICGEIRLHRERGEPPSLEDYQRRFPQFTAELALQFDVNQILDDEPTTGADDEPQAPAVYDVPELPGYEFLERIGSGAAGVVFRARQLSLGRDVAIKVVPLSAADPKHVARQTQEAEILARLKHPNVVHVYEVIHHCGCMYLVMEYIDGPTLNEFTGGKPLKPDVAARFVLSLAEAIRVVHQAGVLHRDLKPPNVLVAAGDQVRITDFGLAKSQSADSRLTTNDSVLGTPSYMSPEQAFGGAGSSGPETDVYSLGAILYELLTGRPPFLGATVLDTLSLIRQQDPVPPRQLQPKVPRDLDTICLHCLNKLPANRYRTADGLADDLRRFLAGEPIVARRASHAERLIRLCRRNPLSATLAAAAALLLFAGFVILTASNARIRREVAAKDAALATARGAVDQMLMRVADDKLNNMPLGHPLRVELLQDALKFYEGFIAQGNDDATLRAEMAAVLNSQGCIERELGRCDDACRSFERSITLLQSIVANDPTPPAMREKLVAAQEALAYTWKINPTASDGREADTHFRRALEMYHQLERDWPERRQPVSHCLRHLADLAFQRGDRTQAEEYWREAITSGEAYLEQHGKNLDAQSNVCWACADLCESILIPMGNNNAEVESILNNGLRHVAIMRQLDPRSGQAREVGAFLRYCLAQSACRNDRAESATGLFQQAIEEMQALCADFPWNRPYWALAQYFLRTAVGELQTADRPAEATQIVERMADWLRTIGPQLPDDPVPQAELRRCRDCVVTLLREMGREKDATSLGRLFSAATESKSRPVAAITPK